MALALVAAAAAVLVVVAVTVVEMEMELAVVVVVAAVAALVKRCTHLLLLDGVDRRTYFQLPLPPLEHRVNRMILRQPRELLRDDRIRNGLPHFRRELSQHTVRHLLGTDGWRGGAGAWGRGGG